MVEIIMLLSCVTKSVYVNADPNIDDPLNPQAAQLWNNQAEFRRVLRSKCSDALDDH